MTIKPETLSEVVRADHIPGPPQGQWTYADYAAIPEDGNRYEIIDGVLYKSPSPNRKHQASIVKFIFYLVTHVQLKGLGEVYPAPFDVELNLSTTLQPDIVVVLKHNLDIITASHVVGTPDLVVEIASPDTAKYDRSEKQEAYARFGIKEYWIADPKAATIEILLLERGQYRSLGSFKGQDILPSNIIPELPVQVEQFFA